MKRPPKTIPTREDVETHLDAWTEYAEELRDIINSIWEERDAAERRKKMEEERQRLVEIARETGATTAWSMITNPDCWTYTPAMCDNCSNGSDCMVNLSGHNPVRGTYCFLYSDEDVVCELCMGNNHFSDDLQDSIQGLLEEVVGIKK